MPLQQGACLGKQGAMAREWLRLKPRHSLKAPFKTMCERKMAPLRKPHFFS